MITFPGPVVLAVNPDAEWRAVWGASEADGGADEAHVRYRSTAPAIPLFIRTVFAAAIDPPVIGTVHDLSTTLLDLRLTAADHRQTAGRRRAPTRDAFRSLAEAAKRDEVCATSRVWSVVVDGVEFRSRRKDLPDCSVAEVPWSHGHRILCAGDTAVIDALALRSAARIPRGVAGGWG